MTQMETIMGYLARKKPKAFCDDCLSDKLDIKPRQTINQIARRMAQDNGYLRGVGHCTMCGSNKKIVNREA